MEDQQQQQQQQELQRQQINGHQDILTDITFKPLRFFLHPPLDRTDELREIIAECGGVVVKDHSAPGVIILSAPSYAVMKPYNEHKIYSYLFVEDSYNKFTQLQLSNYLIFDPDANPTPSINAPGTQAENYDILGSLESEPQSMALRYFTPEEDAVLYEEIRKRPWLGYKGHQIYKEISQTEYFRLKKRSPASLRERIRTLKYDIKYTYVEIGNTRQLLKDANGEYVKDLSLKKKTAGFTALEDFALCKRIYLLLNPVENELGFESMNFTTGFFDTHHKSFPDHTAESWRQRYKNFLSIFGIANYLKYYIYQVKLGQDPLPVNLANKEWLKERKALKDNRESPKRLYFPYIEQGNELLDQEIDMIDIPTAIDVTREVKSSQSFLTPTPPDAIAVATAAAAHSASFSSTNNEYDERPTKRVKVAKPETQPDLLESDNIDPAMSALGAFDEEEMQEQLDAPLEFIEEPTTTFDEQTFRKSFEKAGPPIDLEAILPEKEKFLRALEEVIDAKHSSIVLSEEFSKIGIKGYYTVFLLFRCSSKQEPMKRCIEHYVETGGKELLATGPGIWSNKAINWIKRRDPHLLQLLEAYHGEANFAQILERMRKTNTIKW